MLAAVVSPTLAHAGATRAEFSGPSANRASVGTNVVGAPIRCEVIYGNDVTLSGGFLSVTWAVTCRYTDDGQFAQEVKDITLTVGIAQNGNFIDIRSCPPSTQAFASCTLSGVPFNGVPSYINSLVLATVTWKDSYPTLRDVFSSPGFVFT
jgi:hypothetical protein